MKSNRQKNIGNFTQVPNEICRNENLTVYEKSTLIAIGSYNPSYPSLKNLQKDTGISRGKLIDVLDKLEAQNIIHRRRGSKRSGKNNEYTIRPSSQWKLLPIEEKNKRKGKQPQKSTIRTDISSQSNTPTIPINKTNSLINNTNKDQSTIRTNEAEPLKEDSALTEDIDGKIEEYHTIYEVQDDSLCEPTDEPDLDGYEDWQRKISGREF